MARRMPTPKKGDPTERGKRRGANIDVDDSMLNSELEKQKKDDSTDEETNWVNIRRILRTIPRNNPNDPFKPHSETEIHMLSKLNQPLTQHPLLPAEEEMLQYYGYDLDKCTIYDQPNPSVQRPNISKEHQYFINQLPAWLRCFIELKYKKISKKYGKRTSAFFKALVKYLELLKTKHASLAGEHSGEVEDIKNFMDFEEDYDFIGEEEILKEQELRRQNAGLQLELDPFRLVTEEKSAEEKEKKKQAEREEFKKKKSGKGEESDEELMKENIEEMWSPILLQKAGDALRASLLAGASDTEDEEYYEEIADEITYRKERKKGTVRFKDQEFVYRGAHWETIVAEESNFQEMAEEQMNEEFMRPELFKEYQAKKKKEHNEDKKSEKKANKGVKKAVQNTTTGSHPLLQQSTDNQRNAGIWRERGVGRIPSSLFVKSPCEGPIVEVERRLHQSRRLEAMKAYANWIVATTFFKYFIMFIILGNAALLAIEVQGDIRNDYATAFEFFDSLFLSIYFAEFLLKVFAYPNQYFMSGFNWFDFIILVVAVMKNVADWMNVGHSVYLRYLSIIRALRIIRAVSLSVHIQVLVRALIDTLKNHVVSVVLLLVLLMYITSVVAFYLFGSVSGLNDMFGSFLMGMLQLFTFVTMDGWTDILEQFEEVGLMHQGRVFCLTLIVLGNFLFYNIFIAIIIMQISDATDYFRKTRADERDLKVSRIQDEVFRRQKLDMRNLLARQKLGVADDFYELGERFVRRLRHDDLVDAQEIIFSPLWIDALYKSMQRINHTTNIIMNQHRKMADRLVRLADLYDEDRLNVRGISRSRYNRYENLKSKLRLLKEQFLKLRKVKPKSKMQVKLPDGPAKDRSGRGKKLPAKMAIAATLKSKASMAKKNQSKPEDTDDKQVPKDEVLAQPSDVSATDETTDNELGDKGDVPQKSNLDIVGEPSDYHWTKKKNKKKKTKDGEAIKERVKKRKENGEKKKKEKKEKKKGKGEKKKAKQSKKKEKKEDK